MFAQESVMDIKKLKAEFEKLKYIEEKLEYLNFDEHLGCYVEKNNGMPVGLAAWVNGALYGFNQAKAVPEGFVVVAKELPEKIAEKMAIDRIDKPIHENDPVWSEIAEESYKNQVKLKKWEFWRDYKAMIEAQEQSHECQNP